AAEEMISADSWHALRSVPGLRHGEGTEGRKIRPVADSVVDQTLAYCGPEIRAMVELQRLCGARSGEIVTMRTGDIDRSGKVWMYKPLSHKTERHGHERVIYFGPRAQVILRPWLRPALWEYLFSPLRARERRFAELRAQRKSPVQPSQLSRKR